MATIASGVALLSAAWIHQTGPWRTFRFDDAYITLRYADNLARHGHLSFNLDDRVDGFTSTGWTLLLALAIALGFDGEALALQASWWCGLGAVLLASVLAWRLGAHPACAAALAGIGTACSPGFAAWACCGHDTPYAALAAVAVVLAFATPEGAFAPGRVAASRAVALVVAATARPELSVLVAGLVLGEAWSQRPPGPAAWRLGAWRSSWPALRPYGIAVGILAVLFALHWIYYGYPLGNTYYAKRGTDALAIRGFMDLHGWLADSGLWLGPVSALALAARSSDARRTVGLLAVAAWFAATCWVYASTGGDYVGLDRFYQPLVPVGFAVFAGLVGSVASEGVDRRKTQALALVVAVVGGAWLYWAHDQDNQLAFVRGDGDLRLHTQSADQWRRVGLALRQRFPSNTSMAVRSAGLIPYISGFRTFDFLAVNNAVLAHRAVTHADMPGHTREATPAQIVAWHPDLIVGDPHITRRDMSFAPPADFNSPEYTAAGYTYRCLSIGQSEWVCLWERQALASTVEP